MEKNRAILLVVLLALIIFTLFLLIALKVMPEELTAYEKILKII
ncbi:MAG: hypothetical protein ABH851_05835 [Methanobacteriota archaeon]